MLDAPGYRWRADTRGSRGGRFYGLFTGRSGRSLERSLGWITEDMLPTLFLQSVHQLIQI